MITFKYDDVTGILYAYKDGKLVGPVQTMGDNPDEAPIMRRKEANNGADTVIRAARS